MFVDRVTIRVEAGKGGDGCVSFRREKYIPRGGPDGGDGGNGGSVVVLAQAGIDHLAALAHRKHWKAKSGNRGGGSNCHGRSANDVMIRVPPGTVVRDVDGDYVLKDLVDDGDRSVLRRAVGAVRAILGSSRPPIGRHARQLPVRRENAARPSSN